MSLSKILQSALAIFGWKNVLGGVWKLAKPSIEVAAAKTKTKFDDALVKHVDQMINEIINDPAA